MVENRKKLIAPTQAGPVDVRRLSSDNLRHELGRAVMMTAQALAHLAACWAELERRGEDLSGLRIGLAPYLRDVASGKLAPEAVLSFAGKRMVLRWLAKQPLDEQRAIVAGKPVEVSGPGGETRLVPAVDLTAFDLRDIVMEPTQPRRGPARSSVPAKHRTIVARVSEQEYREIFEQSRMKGKSVSDLVRSALGLTGTAEYRQHYDAGSAPDGQRSASSDS